MMDRKSPSSKSTSKGGRPSKLTPDDKRKILNLAKFGLTDKQLCEGFGINESTLTRCKQRDAEFCTSLKRNKGIADELVKQSLFKKAVGYEYFEEHVNKDGAVRCKKVAHPDTLACIFWLKNRQPEDWKDRHEHDLGKGTVDAAFSFAKLFSQRRESETVRLAKGEDPALVYLGHANGRLGNGSPSSTN